MQMGVFLQDLKDTLVNPLLQKANLDLIDKNYRPVLTLEFMDKTIECAVTSRLIQNILKNSLMEAMQSAYRSGHSTETALACKGQSRSSTCHQLSGSCLSSSLDLSVAFDILDHFLLIQRLEDHFGIKEAALEWIRLYLTESTQKVSVGGSRLPQ